MAIRRLRSIVVTHHEGTIFVDKISIFIAVCRYLIDEIKASMPIWKKEVYTSREVRKENSEFLRMRSKVRVSKIRIPQVHRKVKRVEAERLEDKKNVF